MRFQTLVDGGLANSKYHYGPVTPIDCAMCFALSSHVGPGWDAVLKLPVQQGWRQEG